MSTTPTTHPDVFIIESLTRSDEQSGRYEGHRIQQMLALSGKECKYVYLRTEQELLRVMPEFEKSNYRYLHLSCHGSESTLATTYNSLSFERISEIMTPYLAGRRLFVSACSATTMQLAKQMLKDKPCLSVMGPSCDIHFGDAAMLWTAFYHLMFKEHGTGMKGEAMRRHGAAVAKLFGVELKVFVKDDGNVIGYKSK